MDKIEVDIKAVLEGMTKDDLVKLREEINRRIYGSEVAITDIKVETAPFVPWAGYPYYTWQMPEFKPLDGGTGTPPAEPIKFHCDATDTKVPNN